MKNGIASSAKLSMPVAIRCATRSDPGSSPVAITLSVAEMPTANATGTFKASSRTKLMRRTMVAIDVAQRSALRRPDGGAESLGQEPHAVPGRGQPAQGKREIDVAHGHTERGGSAGRAPVSGAPASIRRT